jgi:hypothetical protein
MTGAPKGGAQDPGDILKEQPQFALGLASVPCPYFVSRRDHATLINGYND